MTEEKNIKQLVQDIFATRDGEIQCRKACILIARCSDALLSDNEAKRQHPQLWHHLGLCPDCAEEYRAVMALARAEATDRLSQTRPVPPVPDEKELRMWQKVETTISVLFSGFSSSMAAAVTRGEERIFEPVTVEFPEDGVTVTLDVAPASSNPQRRDLYCTVILEGNLWNEQLEGAPIWLQTSSHQVVIAERALDELGDALFDGLAPGTYDLRLFLAGREHRIHQIEVP